MNQDLCVAITKKKKKKGLNYCFRIFVKHNYSGNYFYGGGDHMQVVFAPSFLCLWSQTLSRNLRTVVLPRYSLLVLLRWFDVLSEPVGLWNDSFESLSDFFKEFSQ